MNKTNEKRSFSHPLYGSSYQNLKALQNAYGRVDPAYARQWVMALVSAALRSPFTALEKIMARRRINQMDSMPPPIFIVGHWRSGTTHFGNIISKSSAFGSVTPIAAGLPWNILQLGTWLEAIFQRLIPSNRLIDNVTVKSDAPQEDAFGLANMQPISFLSGLYFPEKFDEAFAKGVFLENCSPQELRHWKAMHTHYLKKIYLHQNKKQLVIRNPIYTTRIKLLKQLWPGAKFIHLYRNPYRVFLSMQNYFRKLLPALALQEYDHLNINDIILSTYPRMMDVLITDSEQLDSESFINVRYENLIKHPIPTLRSVYEQLRLGDFSEAEPAFRSYLQSIRRYKKNTYRMNENKRIQIQQRWKKYIDYWGYA